LRRFAWICDRCIWPPYIYTYGKLGSVQIVKTYGMPEYEHCCMGEKCIGGQGQAPAE
jgi:hypothetical protein